MSVRRVYAFPLRDMSDTDISERLAAGARHRHIQSFQIDLQVMGVVPNQLLLRALSTRKKLEEVTLIDHEDPSLRNDAERVTPFLQAIQRNSSIHAVHLESVSGKSAASFLNTATSVTSFSMIKCDVAASGGVQGAQELAASLQRNVNIRTLVLECAWLSNFCWYPILSSLEYNTHVKVLKLKNCHCLLPIDASEALGRVFESTKTMDRLEFDSFRFEETSFRSIAQGLVNSTSITDIKLAGCSFSSKESALLLTTIIKFKPNLQSFALIDCRVTMRDLRAGLPNLPPRLLAALLRSGPQPEFLELLFTDTDFFATLLGLVAKSSLDCFCVEDIGPQANFNALVLSIPTMKLTKLQVRVSDYIHPDSKTGLLRAVKMNSSLRSVVVTWTNGQDFFDEDDHRKLNYYAARNENIAQWIAVPAAVPMGSSPKNLKAGQDTGPVAIARILQALGPLVGPTFEDINDAI
jgi:hypothetical protein